MNFEIGNVSFDLVGIIFIAVLFILILTSLIVNYKIFKRIKSIFIKILFFVEVLIRAVASYYIFYYFILILALNSTLMEKILYGLLFVSSLFIPVIPQLILIFFMA
ncbi:MAG: hypothetical protein Q4A58_01225 [Fusobacterium sp.]|uniref:hypothetical protein n=1 Tax=Fusobacterium sp. TaxID=68766 RepID=UPI0026DBF037|nr:hypothetical protein [Fusobacterium sp.]MDO4689904.1 hypothetical protein [Fusobacterium sp.]